MPSDLGLRGAQDALLLCRYSGSPAMLGLGLRGFGFWVLWLLLCSEELLDSLMGKVCFRVQQIAQAEWRAKFWKY